MKSGLPALFFLFVFLNSAFGFQPQQIKDGYDVIEAMHATYQGKWYKYLRFTQETTFYGTAGEVVRTQNWYEAMSFPGKLAIKFDDAAGDNGILFADGKQYGFANGALIQEADRIHDLLVLGYDVYHQPPEETAAQLTTNGYNLSAVYEDVWQGRPVYVVGTARADSAKPQFWVDAERLVFVRNLTVGRGNTIQEIQFNNYEPLGEAWIAPEVVFKANGFKGLLEEYHNIEVPDSVSEDIFNPRTFTTADWGNEL